MKRVGTYEKSADAGFYDRQRTTERGGIFLRKTIRVASFLFRAEQQQAWEFRQWVVTTGVPPARNRARLPARRFYPGRATAQRHQHRINKKLMLLLNTYSSRRRTDCQPSRRVGTPPLLLPVGCCCRSLLLYGVPHHLPYTIHLVHTYFNHSHMYLLNVTYLLQHYNYGKGWLLPISCCGARSLPFHRFRFDRWACFNASVFWLRVAIRVF